MNFRFLPALGVGAALAIGACQSQPDQAAAATAVVAPAPPADLASLITFHKRYTGTIGRSAIVLTLYKDSTGAISGSYYYHKKRLPLTLRGRMRGPEVVVSEQDEAGKITGRLKGQLTATGWAGTWTNPRSGAPLPLQLREDYVGTARLTYGSKEERDCAVRFENRSAGVDNCSYVFVSLPLIEEHDPLNERVRQVVMDDGSGSTEYVTTDLAAWMKKRVASGPVQSEITVTEVNNEYHLLSLQMDESTDGGGAHPNHGTHYANFDLKRDTKIQLKDLLVPGYEQRLLQLGRRLFYEQNANNPMLHDADEFEMNENFLITPKGLAFHFNPYEAAAYAGGDPKVFITYRELGPLLKANSPAQAFIAGRL